MVRSILFVLVMSFFVVGCSSGSKDADTDVLPDTDISGDSDEIVTDPDIVMDEDAVPDEDTKQGREFASVRMLGNGGFFGISGSSFGQAEFFGIGAHYEDLNNNPDDPDPSGTLRLFNKADGIPTSYEAAALMLFQPQKNPGAGFAYTIGNLCDINHDGYLDLPVSSHLDSVGDTNNCGTVNVFFGSDAGYNETDAVMLYLSDDIRAKADVIGQSLVCFDTNGDGYDDIVAGGQNAGPADTGLVAIWLGSAGGFVKQTQDSVLVPAVAQNKQYFGSGLVFGDFNNDSLPDLVASGWGLMENDDAERTGGAYVYKGGDDWQAGPAAMIFPDQSDTRSFGQSMKMLTIKDTEYIAISSSTYELHGGVFLYLAGQVFEGAPVADIILPALLASDMAELSAFDANPDLFGKDASGIILGLKYCGTQEKGTTGCVELVPFPRSDTEEKTILLYPDSLAEGDGFGAMVTTLGDLNNDTLSDFMVGIPEHLEGDMYTGKQTGGVFFFY